MAARRGRWRIQRRCLGPEAALRHSRFWPAQVARTAEVQTREAAKKLLRIHLTSPCNEVLVTDALAPARAQPPADPGSGGGIARRRPQAQPFGRAFALAQNRRLSPTIRACKSTNSQKPHSLWPERRRLPAGSSEAARSPPRATWDKAAAARGTDQAQPTRAGGRAAYWCRATVWELASTAGWGKRRPRRDGPRGIAEHRAADDRPGSTVSGPRLAPPTGQQQASTAVGVR